MPRPIHPIKVRAQSRGMLLTEVAAKVGVSPSTLLHVVNHHRKPWPKIRRDLAALFGVEEADLFADDLEAVG